MGSEGSEGVSSGYAGSDFARLGNKPKRTEVLEHISGDRIGLCSLGCIYMAILGYCVVANNGVLKLM